MKKTILIAALIIAACGRIDAGIDCRTTLNAHLKPLYEGSGISWATELTVAPGWMDDRKIANALVLLGIDYSFNGGLHSFYAEGGYKNWYNSLSAPREQKGPGKDGGQIPTEENWGAREFFYKYNGSSTKITAGLQTMTIGDYFLMDERAVGVKYIQELGAGFTLTSNLASVHKNFARQANFCGVRYVYSQIRGKSYNFLGSYLGESNLFGLVVKWKPGSSALSGTDEIAEPMEDSDIGAEEISEPSEEIFEKEEKEEKDINITEEPSSKPETIDEFQTDDEFSISDESGEFSSADEEESLLKELGLIYYEEFGPIFHNYKYYYGLMSSFNIPWDILLRFETVYQHIPDDQAMVIFLDAGKSILWDEGDMTDLSIGLFTKKNFRENNLFYPSFSNLYYGEVIRRDAQDIPFAFVSVQYHFNWDTKFSVKAQYIKEANNGNNEIDLIGTLKFLSHFKLSAIFASMQSELLEKPLFMARFELRTAI